MYFSEEIIFIIVIGENKNAKGLNSFKYFTNLTELLVTIFLTNCFWKGKRPCAQKVMETIKRPENCVCFSWEENIFLGGRGGGGGGESTIIVILSKRKTFKFWYSDFGTKALRRQKSSAFPSTEIMELRWAW